MTQFFDAFISYGRADSKAFATKLQARLHERGFKVWFDFNDIPLAVDFQNQIDDGIERAHNFLFIIAPHSVNSAYCLKEIDLAIKYNKRIIPLLHVEKISRETWQQRNPTGTDEQWTEYQKEGKHDHFQNMHPLVRKINWVYFREGIDDFEQSLASLIKLLGHHADYVEQHTQLLAKALTWKRHQKSHSCLLVADEKTQARNWLKTRFKNEQAPCRPSNLHCEYITESIKNANNLMTQVFLSYADEDREIMEKIRNSLRRESFTVWTNTTDIQTGEAFEEAIQRGIEQADNVVYLLSPDSAKSKYTQRELDYALSLNKRIIPILVREIPSERIPNELQALHHIDRTDNVKEEDYYLDESQLLGILNHDAAYYNEHKILLTKALKWKQQHDNPSILLRGYNLRSAEAWLKTANKRTQHRPTALIEEFIAASLRQPPATSLDVFISYSRADSDFARKLNEELQLQGKATWFDQESIASGVDFQREIYRGIETCDNFLFVLSPRSVNSPYCKDEVEYAAGLNKRFVTVLHQPVTSEELHPELAKVQWIDFNRNERDFQANFRQLVRTLDTDREHLRSHTKWSQRAIEWQEKGKSDDLLLRGSELAVAEAWVQETRGQKKQPAATELQRDYIARSSRYKRKNRLLLRGAVGSVIAIMTAAAIGSIILWRRAERQTKIAELRENAARVQSLLSFEPVEALVLAIQATKESHSSPQGVREKTFPQLRSSLLDASREVRERNLLQGHEGEVYSVALSPDGQRIVSGDSDGTIRLWDRDGTPIGEPLRGHGSVVYSVAFSPDGQRIVSGSWDGTIRLWDRDGTPVGEPLRGHGGGVHSVAFSPDGQTIVSGGRNRTIRLWKTDGEPLLDEPLQGHEGEVYSVALSPDGQRIVSGSFDGTIRLWDRDGTPIGEPLRGHGGGVHSVAFSPDGQRIVSGSFDGTVRLWDRDGTPIGQPFRGHGDWVYSVAFSPDSQTIVSGSRDRTIRLWDTEGTPMGQPLRGHEGAVTSVAFSPDGQTIVSSNWDGTIRLWDTEGAPMGQPLRGHGDEVSSVAFSPDGQTIVSGSEDGTIRLWDNEGTPMGQPLRGHEDLVYSVAFSPDGQTIVSGSRDRTIRLWNTDGTPIGQPLRGHGGGVSSVAFSPDGQRIASGSFDGTIRLWDTNGTPIGQPFRGHGGVISVAFSPDGQTIVSGGRDWTIRLWKTDGNWQDWLDEACNRLIVHPVLVAPETLLAEDTEFFEVADNARETCQNSVWDNAGKAQFLVHQGFAIARQGDKEGANTKFQQARKLSPNINVPTPEQISRWAAEGLRNRGEKLVEEKKFKEALVAYNDALSTDPAANISAGSWNHLCWEGSLHGEAATVMPACQKAVALEPESGEFRDSRGVARALTGDKQGAIEDFQAFIEDSQAFIKENQEGENLEYLEFLEERMGRRQGWIDDLKVGKNPLTEEEIEQLRRFD